MMRRIMDFIKRMLGTLLKRGKPQNVYNIPPTKEKAKVLTRYTNGKVDRRLRRLGSGAGRYWPSWNWGTADSNKRGWYKSASRAAG